MRSLCIVLRQCFWGVAPYCIRGIEDGVVFLISLEPVVELYRRSAYSQPRCVDVLFEEHIVVEVIDIGSVRIHVTHVDHIMEVPVVLPCYDSLEMHRVGNCECLKDTRSRLSHAVSICSDAVFYFHLACSGCNESGESLFGIVFFALHSCQGCIPGIEFRLCDVCGILDVQ